MSKFADIEALAFDYYGTIADKQALAAEIEDHLPGRGADFAKLWFATTQRYCFQNGMMGRFMPWSELTKAAFVFAAQDMGLAVDDATRDAWIEADTRLPVYAEAAAALARLNAKYRLYVLSMGSPWMIERSQENAGIAEHFTGVISAEPARLYKPGHAAYQLGVDGIGAPKQRIGFVSGNAFDVIGAANFGFPTVWVRRYGQALDALGLKPDLVVKDLAEMADALGA